MRVITSITNQPKQRIVLKLDNNETVIMKLYYYATQKSWYFDIEYKDYQNKGNKVVITLNAIRHLRNKLPFGLMFVSGDNADPFQLDDFINQNVYMILLNQDEVEEIESTVYSG